jgi:hypothetical protein
MHPPSHLVGIVTCLALGTWAPVASAQTPSGNASCDPSWLVAGAVSAQHLAVTTPAFPASRCVGVNIGPLEIAAPVAVPDASTCEVAVLHRRVIVQSELCGNDVHFEPIVQVGVVVLRRRGDAWTRIASGMLDVEIPSSATIAARDTDADGHAELVLDGRLVLAIERRRVRVLRTVTP